MEDKVYMLNAFAAVPDCPNVHPYEAGARSGAKLPSGWPIRSTIFVVDKMDMIVCDGQDNWYRNVNGITKAAVAGQPIYTLF